MMWIKSSLRNYSTLKAASLLETILALAILLICMSISISLLTSVTKHKISINEILMVQEIEELKSEMVIKNEIIEEKRTDNFVIFTELIEKISDGKTKKIKFTIEMNNHYYTKDFYVRFR